MTKIQVNNINNKLRMIAVDKKIVIESILVNFGQYILETQLTYMNCILMDRLHLYNLYYIKV